MVIDIAKFDNFITALEGIIKESETFDRKEDITVCEYDVVIRKKHYDLLLDALSNMNGKVE